MREENLIRYVVASLAIFLAGKRIKWHLKKIIASILCRILSCSHSTKISDPWWKIEWLVALPSSRCSICSCCSVYKITRMN